MIRIGEKQRVERRNWEGIKFGSVSSGIRVLIGGETSSIGSAMVRVLDWNSGFDLNLD